MDTFIQPKIAGYRQLGAEEAALMNEAKTLGAAFEELIGRLRDYHKAQRVECLQHLAESVESAAERTRLNACEPERWLAMGRTDIQTGVMKIVRSIAQPTQ